MKSYLVELQCITNMHAGSGDVNYNIIDKEVERDPVTGYPTINASGVKGALREYFVNKTEENGKKVDAYDKGLLKDDVDRIFGSESGSEGKTNPGQVKILAAEMVARPMRASGGDKPFYMVTTKEAVERVNLLAKTFLGMKEDELSKVETINGANVQVEGYELKQKTEICFKIHDEEKTDIYVLENQKFSKVDLPVIARNCLENGISKNLWYEEIVPHNSIFIFPITSANDKLIETFKNALDGEVIQFGANASIGYGLCKVTVHEKKES